jgi:hypothetical protein
MPKIHERLPLPGEFVTASEGAESVSRVDWSSAAVTRPEMSPCTELVGAVISCWTTCKRFRSRLVDPGLGTTAMRLPVRPPLNVANLSRVYRTTYLTGGDIRGAYTGQPLSHACMPATTACCCAMARAPRSSP